MAVQSWLAPVRRFSGICRLSWERQPSLLCQVSNFRRFCIGHENTSGEETKAQVRPRGILERLGGGECVVGDGGMTFALEKRGYVKAGVWTPECTVQNPEAVRQLHREYLRAGADVLQAFTFALDSGSKIDEEKREQARNINQAACDLAKSVALEGGVLFAGSICQTGRMYTSGAGKQAVQEHFQQEIQPFVDNNVDFLIAEFFEFSEEAVWATEVMKSTGLPVAVTMCIGPHGDSNNVPSGECAVKLALAGADIVGVNCRFDPSTSLKTCEIMKEALDEAGLQPFLMVQPTGYHSPDGHPKLGFSAIPELPFALEPRLLTRWEVQKFVRQAYEMGIRYIGGCCGFEPYHVRAIAEELSPERGGWLPPASDKHSPWGEAQKTHINHWMRHKSTREYWENLAPATGRPQSPAFCKPDDV